MSARAGSSAEHRSLEQAYHHCARVARGHYENFPVASLLVPATMRPHVAAIYAYARTADDLADEGQVSAEARMASLQAWQAALHESLAGGAVPEGDTDLVCRALAHTIRVNSLPVSLFDDLISAFVQDVHTHRYATWEEVLDYCRRSANPVGRLVLRLAGVVDARADAWSDHVCTALQLANFWQDLAVDWTRGRLYVPLCALASAEADVGDLDAGVVSPAWRCVMSEAVDRTEHLFALGRPVCDVVRGRLRWELRATWLGGMKVLSKLRAGGYDVFRRRPVVGVADMPHLFIQMLRWRARGIDRIE